MKSVPKKGRNLLFQPLARPARHPISTHYLVLSFVLIVALVLGMTGLSHGLPYFPKIDEYSKVRGAVRIAATHNPSPGWFGHPGSTLIYPLAFVHKIWGSVSYQVPIWETNPDLLELLEEDPGEAEYFEEGWAVYYLIGRWLNLFYFVAGILVTYLVGVRVWDKRVALLAAWFMAITLILIYHAQILRTDLAGLLFFMIGCLACLHLLTSQEWYDYAIAGAAIGVAGSSRYFNLSLGAMLVLAHFLSGAYRDRGCWKRLSVGLAAIGVGFAVTTPAFVFSLRTVYHDLRVEVRSSSIPLTVPGKLWYYLSFALPDALTWPIWLLAITGAFLAWRRQNKKAILLLLASVAFLLTIVVPSLYWQRWIIPLVPISLLFAANTLWVGLDTLEKRKPGFARWGRSLLGLLVVTLSIVPLKNSVRYVHSMTQVDTRALAARWAEANLPPSSRIAREWYTPIVPRNDLSVTYTRFLYELGPLETLAGEYDYLVASSYAYDRFFRVADQRPENVESYGEQVGFYEQLLGTQPVEEFKSESWKTPGPTIGIYRTRELAVSISR